MGCYFMTEHQLEPFDECPFEARLAHEWPLTTWQDVSVMIAVSGGPDSVALLVALHTLRQNSRRQNGIDAPGRFEAAHFNHRWRGEASDEDERFVAELCGTLSVPLHIDRATEETNVPRSEVAARDQRYAFLQRTAEQRGARYLVTAHTANDQAETIMHRILRGTSMHGRRGIQATRKISAALTVVRPVLWARRSDVVEYLERKQQGYRTDSSNADQKYTRNRIRADLLPKLAEDYNPSVVEALLRLGTLANETMLELDSLVAKKAIECRLSNSVENSDAIELDLERLANESEFMQREIILHLWRQQGWPEQGMSFQHWTKLVKSIHEQTVRSFPGSIELRAGNRQAKLTRRS